MSYTCTAAKFCYMSKLQSCGQISILVARVSNLQYIVARHCFYSSKRWLRATFLRIVFLKKWPLATFKKNKNKVWPPYCKFETPATKVLKHHNELLEIEHMNTYDTTKHRDILVIYSAHYKGNIDTSNKEAYTNFNLIIAQVQ